MKWITRHLVNLLLLSTTFAIGAFAGNDTKITSTASPLRQNNEAEKGNKEETTATITNNSINSTTTTTSVKTTTTISFVDLIFDTINPMSLGFNIALPCASVFLIALSLTCIMFCHRRKLLNSSNNSINCTSTSTISTSDNNQNPSSRNSTSIEQYLNDARLAYVYLDVDAATTSTVGAAENANSVSSSLPRATSREVEDNSKNKPPDYEDIFKLSKNVDKLPTYNSFRKKFNKDDDAVV